MVVIKASDQEENFSIDKLAASVFAANAGTEETLDVELFLAEFRSIVAEKEFITTGQINVVAYGLLFSKGAVQTLKNYAEFKRYR